MAEFLDRAVHSHVQWKLKLLAAINHGETIDKTTAGVDNQCELGKWIYGAGQAYQHHEAFRALQASHKRFHDCVGHVANLIARGKLDEARNDIAKGAYKQASAETVDCLTKLKAAAVVAA